MRGGVPAFRLLLFSFSFFVSTSNGSTSTGDNDADVVCFWAVPGWWVSIPAGIEMPQYKLIDRFTPSVRGKSVCFADKSTS
ncbi:hypothetical protein L1887_05885 [Cichorium endivia]|nr:hypothetical protein L1887_05885 [Cichorium endivia]